MPFWISAALKQGAAFSKIIIRHSFKLNYSTQFISLKLTSPNKKTLLPNPVLTAPATQVSKKPSFRVNRQYQTWFDFVWGKKVPRAEESHDGVTKGLQKLSGGKNGTHVRTHSVNWRTVHSQTCSKMISLASSDTYPLCLPRQYKDWKCLCCSFFEMWKRKTTGMRTPRSKSLAAYVYLKLKYISSKLEIALCIILFSICAGRRDIHKLLRKDLSLQLMNFNPWKLPFLRQSQNMMISKDHTDC